HQQERRLILQEIHDGHGHFGQHASWARLYFEYWWPTDFVELRDYIQTCEKCQLFANLPKYKSKGSVPVFQLFEQFSIDFVGPLPISSRGNSYVLVAIENFTSWPIALATEKADAANVTSFLYENIFC
ncbi:hypothetical protein CLU79DRAFT_669470, partial [Phycomyces nitens]